MIFYGSSCTYFCLLPSFRFKEVATGCWLLGTFEPRDSAALALLIGFLVCLAGTFLAAAWGACYALAWAVALRTFSEAPVACKFLFALFTDCFVFLEVAAPRMLPVELFFSDNFFINEFRSLLLTQ